MPPKEEPLPPPKEPTFFDSRVFKLFTLGLYIGGISGMGFILSIYYFFIWNSEMPPIPEYKGKKLMWVFFTYFERIFSRNDLRKLLKCEEDWISYKSEFPKFFNKTNFHVVDTIATKYSRDSTSKIPFAYKDYSKL